MSPHIRYRRARGAVALAPLAAAMTLCFSANGYAATIFVNSASDVSVSGKCTLLDAVAAVNGLAAVNACAAGNGNNDTIDLSFFSIPTAITFALASSADAKSALALSRAATIRGNLDAGGTPLVTIARSSVSGTPKFRLLASSANVTVQGLALSGGLPHGRGGAIYASGAANITISHSVISGNSTQAYSGGAVDAESGSITINSSSITNNSVTRYGGGVYTPNAGTITLNNSTVSYNTAGGKGGGVASFQGNVVVNGSTLASNYAQKGGGIYAHQDVTLTNSTISGNGASYYGGGVYARSRAFVYFSTIANNMISSPSMGAGGGLATSPSQSVGAYFRAVASIFASNSKNDVSVGDYATCSGNNNIIRVFQGCAPIGNNTCDPQLGPLLNNGGPTLTRNLPNGSCAINAGPVNAPGNIHTDQRGAKFLRKFGAATDIGAYEAQPNERIFYDGFESGA